LIQEFNNVTPELVTWNQVNARSSTANYIEPIVPAHGLPIFYPSTPSAHETGPRRGCVIFDKNITSGTTLAPLPLLREAGLIRV
jgi:hypothetical protein